MKILKNYELYITIWYFLIIFLIIYIKQIVIINYKVKIKQTPVLEILVSIVAVFSNV